jgi:hypothetical protein
MTATLLDLRPGDLGFGPISGIAGVTVRLGELLVAPVDHWRTWGTWRNFAHCGTVTQAATSDFAWGHDGAGGQVSRGTGPLFAQAMPPGYEEIELGAEHWTSQWVYIRPDYKRIATGPAATPGVSQADLVATLARMMVTAKTPYGFEDYAAIAGHRIGLHSAGLDAFIARTDAIGLPQRAICSQGVDAQLTLSGGLDAQGHVFNDGRLAQDVTPSELYLKLMDLHPVRVFLPESS